MQAFFRIPPETLKTILSFRLSPAYGDLLARRGMRRCGAVTLRKIILEQILSIYNIIYIIYYNI